MLHRVKLRKRWVWKQGMNFFKSLVYFLLKSICPSNLFWWHVMSYSFSLDLMLILWRILFCTLYYFLDTWFYAELLVKLLRGPLRFGRSYDDDNNNSLIRIPILFSQDERLARFVVGSHMKHHPNASENLDVQMVELCLCS